MGIPDNLNEKSLDGGRKDVRVVLHELPAGVDDPKGRFVPWISRVFCRNVAVRDATGRLPDFEVNVRADLIPARIRLRGTGFRLYSMRPQLLDIGFTVVEIKGLLFLKLAPLIGLFVVHLSAPHSRQREPLGEGHASPGGKVPYRTDGKKKWTLIGADDAQP